MVNTAEKTTHKNINLIQGELESLTINSPDHTSSFIRLTSEGGQTFQTIPTFDNIENNFVQSDTTISTKQPYISNVKTKTETERTYSKVISIDENNSRAKIKMYLPKGEILRSIDVNMLKAENLANVGTKFYFTVIREKSGYRVQFEPYISEYNPEMEDIFDEINEMIE